LKRDGKPGNLIKRKYYMEGPIKKIMVYIDGTEESITAGQYAICLSKSAGAELSALYVINTRALNELLRARIFIKSEQEEYKNDLEKDADRYLKHIKALADEKAINVNLIKASGNIIAEIKKSVKELDIDLLVIGELSRIQSRLDELHNEVERAMRSVSCSVLIVKDQERVETLYESLK